MRNRRKNRKYKKFSLLSLADIAFILLFTIIISHESKLKNEDQLFKIFISVSEDIQIQDYQLFQLSNNYSFNDYSQICNYKGGRGSFKDYLEELKHLIQLSNIKAEIYITSENQIKFWNVYSIYQKCDSIQNLIISECEQADIINTYFLIIED